MGVVRVREPVMWVAGAFGRDLAALAWTKAALMERLGGIACESEPFDFVETACYRKQMGTGLKKQFWVFERLSAPDGLPELKRWTNELEARYRDSGDFPVARPLNIDPGYMTLGKLVLASTKDHSHRVFIGEGMFAEVTLHYRDNRWEFWPWTYHDYRRENVLEFFTRARRILHKRLRSMPS